MTGLEAVLIPLIPTLAPTVLNGIARLIHGHPDTKPEQREALDRAFAGADAADAVWANLAPTRDAPTDPDGVPSLPAPPADPLADARNPL